EVGPAGGGRWGGGGGEAGVPVRLEVRHPRPQRERVVLAQRLYVARLEAGALDRRDHAADLVELAVGEDVPVDEATAREPRPPLRRRSRHARGAADGVVEEATPGRQELVAA